MVDSTQLNVLNKFSFSKDYDDQRLTDLLPYLDKESFRKNDLIIRTGSQGNKVCFVCSF
jgi:hypothetical protein